MRVGAAIGGCAGGWKSRSVRVSVGDVEWTVAQER